MTEITSAFDLAGVNTDFDANIGVREVFTDNVGLDSDDEANGDLISVISPRLTVYTTGTRLTSRTDYLLQQIVYKNTSGSRLQHNINSQSHIELFKDHFFTDVRIQNGQQNIPVNGSLALDNLSNNNNIEDVFSYQIEPYWQQRISDVANVSVGLIFNEIFADRNDSDSSTTYFNIENGYGVTGFDYNIQFSNREISRERTGDVRFTNITSKITYPFSPQFSLVGSLGYDDNDFNSSGDQSGVAWNFGAIWHPSTQTNLEFSYGDRFFGTDMNIIGSHRTAKSFIRVSFDQTVEVTRSALLNQQVFNLVDNFGDVLVNPNTNNTAGLNIGAIEQREEVLVTDTLIGTYTYNHRRNTFATTFTFIERNFQVSEDTDEVFSMRFDWDRQIKRNLRSNVGVIYQNRIPTTNNESNNYIIDYSITRELGRTFDLVLGFRHALFEPEQTDGYLENRATLSLNKSF